MILGAYRMYVASLKYTSMCWIVVYTGLSRPTTRARARICVLNHVALCMCSCACRLASDCNILQSIDWVFAQMCCMLQIALLSPIMAVFVCVFDGDPNSTIIKTESEYRLRVCVFVCSTTSSINSERSGPLTLPDH